MSETISAYEYRCQLLRLKPKTIQDYTEDLGYLNKFAAQRDKELTQLTAADMEVFFLGMMERSLSGYTINGRLRFYRRFYGFLLERGLVATNPTLTCSYIRPERREKVLVTPTDFNRVITRLRARRDFFSLRDECLLLLAYDTAMRLNELLTLKISSLQFNPRMVHFMGKGRKERVASFGPETTKRLMLYLSRRSYRKIPGDLVFCTRDGKPIQTRLGYRIFKCSGAAVGVKIGPHLVRHSVATLLWRQTRNLEFVRSVLGHASVQTTQIYTHSNQQDIIDAYREFSPVSHALEAI